MVNFKTAVTKTKKLLATTPDSAGFTLVEFVIALFIFTIVVMGVFNLLSVNLLGLRISKDRQSLENIATSQLQELVTVTKCVPLDPLLEVCAGDCAAKYKEITLEGKPVTCEWKTYEEPVTESEAVKMYRMELYAYFSNNPVIGPKYVATKICYQQ